MEKCLKSVLQFEANNENLPVFGELKLHHYVGEGNESGLIIKGKGVKISVASPNYFTISSGTEHVTNHKMDNDELIVLHFSAGDYDIIIHNKYNLVLLGTDSGGVSVDNIGMNIEDCEYLVNLQGLRFPFNSNHSTGSIKSLGKLIHLGEDYDSSIYQNSFNMLGCGSKYINGSVEDFVYGQVQNGRLNTNTYPIKYYANFLASITFGGQKITNIIGSGNSWITWENASKIAIYKGSTIDASTNVYVRGYTDSEITSNQASGEVWEGKTVTDVVSGTVYPPAN